MRVIIWILTSLLTYTVAANEKKVVCYWGSWSIYYPGNGHFNTSNIDPKLCTHLLYAFVGLGPNGTIRILDPGADLPDNGGNDGYNHFNQLRDKNPSLKTMISIGGWNEGSVNYSRMVTDADIRKAFVRNAVKFVKKYKFDGLDLDWEYPAQRGGAKSDVQNFVLLLKQLRKAFDKEDLLLSAAVGSAAPIAGPSYDIRNVAKYLDFVNLMTYDLHISSENVTGSNAPLYPGSRERYPNLLLNANAAVHYWLLHGAPAEKLILGVPLYGHVFTLTNVSNTEIGSPSSGPGKAGPYTGEAGNLGYNEICEMQMTEKWTISFNKQQRVPHAVKGNQWITYDNVESVKQKAQYIKDLGLGGVMVWSIETDDFRGICGEKYPLLKTLNQELLSSRSV